MSDPILYTAFDSPPEDGLQVIRITLHPMADLDLRTDTVSESAHDFGDATWPYQVIWSVVSSPFDRWYPSCGGAGTSYGCKQQPGGLDPEEQFKSFEDALQWLLDEPAGGAS